MCCCMVVTHDNMTVRSQMLRGHSQDTDPSQHSPWELFDEGVSAEQMRAEAPSLHSAERQRLQAALKQLMRMRKYQLFCDTPSPDAVYATGDAGPALPLFDHLMLQQSQAPHHKVKCSGDLERSWRWVALQIYEARQVGGLDERWAVQVSLCGTQQWCLCRWGCQIWWSACATATTASWKPCSMTPAPLPAMQSCTMVLVPT